MLTGPSLNRQLRWAAYQGHIIMPYCPGITRLSLRDIRALSNRGLSIGALVSNADLANDEHTQGNYPLLSSALLAGASPQLRNAASSGGNLLQRMRCHYFLRCRHAVQQARAGK